MTPRSRRPGRFTVEANDLEEREYSNVYAIPANYTDSGKLLGGMLEPRNAVETALLVIIIGYPELFWLPVSGMIRIVIATLTVLPLAVISIIGIDNDSLLQYFGHIVRFLCNRRKLHLRRVGYKYGPKKHKKEAQKQRKPAPRRA